MDPHIYYIDHKRNKTFRKISTFAVYHQIQSLRDQIEDHSSILNKYKCPEQSRTNLATFFSKYGAIHP